ncbi:MAG TPA: fumarylacetoacetate hydrolase family protein [Opitutaceae bacterium]|nr:fumarylacetoacetate hydrolase family protein [Opitutaceae bacterium]
MKVYVTSTRLIVEFDGQARALSKSFTIDDLFVEHEPEKRLKAELRRSTKIQAMPKSLAPLRSQEVWAAGVTYLRTRAARIADSKESGGSSFYDRIYRADRPELFFKATPHRVVATGDSVRIRRDSQWTVPEPELTLAINAHGRVFGYTIGNDVSSRDIEAANPLYLPQSKIYQGSASLGPCLWVTSKPLDPSAQILMDIRRRKKVVFSGQTSVDQIKRTFSELSQFLYRDNVFPFGCYLMTGTGIVPPDNFSLKSGDEIFITIPPIGTLVNGVS